MMSSREHGGGQIDHSSLTIHQMTVKDISIYLENE
jgi:hypothetical protein